MAHYISNQEIIEKLSDERYFSEFKTILFYPGHCPYHNNNHNGNGSKSGHCDLINSPVRCNGFWHAELEISPLDGIISEIKYEVVCDNRRKLDID